MFLFGDFELDGARFELRKGGVPLAVQPKVLRLLLYLVAQRHRAVPVGEILAELWPHETVTRASVKRAILGVRTTLGDAEVSHIRTVRGYGYQFVAPVCCPRETSGVRNLPEPGRDLNLAEAGTVSAFE